MADARKCPGCGSALPGGAPEGLCPRGLLQRGLEPNTKDQSIAGGSSPSPAWTPPNPADLGGSFPDLESLEFIARGGMGAVYKARQKSLDRVVALKILPPAIARDPTFAGRFAREAQAMARLNHPSIVAIYEFGQRGDLFYFMMEFVDGLSLRQLLDAGGVAPKEALAIVPQICDALQYAHDQGIVHRDIKPENILLNKQGRVKIADFGLAKLMSRALPEASGVPGQAVGRPDEKVMGTPQYMAPEQAERPSEVDHRADIYSLGVVFYQMLTGELPVGRFDAPSHKVQIDVRLDEVVLKALEKEPDRRYQQAAEVKTRVETIVATRLEAAGKVPSTTGARRDNGLSLMRRLAAAFVAAAVVGDLVGMVINVDAYQNVFWSEPWFSLLTGLMDVGLLWGILAFWRRRLDHHRLLWFQTCRPVTLSLVVAGVFILSYFGTDFMVTCSAYFFPVADHRHLEPYPATAIVPAIVVSGATVVVPLMSLLATALLWIWWCDGSRRTSRTLVYAVAGYMTAYVLMGLVHLALIAGQMMIHGDHEPQLLVGLLDAGFRFDLCRRLPAGVIGLVAYLLWRDFRRPSPLLAA